MIATAVQFTGRVGYVTDSGLPVHQLVGEHPQPWIGRWGALFPDREVTEVTDTRELFDGERVFYRRTRQYATVRHAQWVNLETGWLYTLALINGGTLYSTALNLERMTVRVGDFVEGRHITTDRHHRGRVTEIIRPVPFNTGGVAYRLDQANTPGAPFVIFDEFLYPLVGECW